MTCHAPPPPQGVGKAHPPVGKKTCSTCTFLGSPMGPHTTPHNRKKMQRNKGSASLPSTSRLSRQLPQVSCPSFSQREALSAAWAPAGVPTVAHSPPRCKLPLPRHDRCSCYSVFSSQDKSFPNNTKPTRDCKQNNLNRNHLLSRALLCHPPQTWHAPCPALCGLSHMTFSLHH